MKINKKKRKFVVGNTKIQINHKADIFLKNNELITFIDNRKMGYDVVKKDWGYYATPSINSRLKDNNFKTVLISNMQNRIYIILVEKENIKKFKKYCKDEKLKIIIWLDDQSKINKLQNF